MMQPKPITDVLLAFPADVTDLIPAEDDIPDRYWEPGDDWSARLFNQVFFRGVKQLALMPREGIDGSMAWRHIRAIMGSFQPKHEHKEAACRFLLDQWFSGGQWQ